MGKTHIIGANGVSTVCGMKFTKSSELPPGYAYKANGSLMDIAECGDVANEDMYYHCRRCLKKAPLNASQRKHYDWMQAGRRGRK